MRWPLCYRCLWYRHLRELMAVMMSCGKSACRLLGKQYKFTWSLFATAQARRWVTRLTLFTQLWCETLLLMGSIMLWITCEIIKWRQNTVWSPQQVRSKVLYILPHRVDLSHIRVRSAAYFRPTSWWMYSQVIGHKQKIRWKIPLSIATAISIHSVPSSSRTCDQESFATCDRPTNLRKSSNYLTTHNRYLLLLHRLDDHRLCSFWFVDHTINSKGKHCSFCIADHMINWTETIDPVQTFTHTFAGPL